MILKFLSTSTLRSRMNTPKLDILDAVRCIIPNLNHMLHKGQMGRVGVVGGCTDYTGAPYFAAISAMKVGADLSHVFCVSAAAPIIKAYSPELIVHPILDSTDIKSDISPWLPRLHCLVIGPGLGNDSFLHANVKKILSLLKDRRIPIILDAEGIKCLPDLSITSVYDPSKITLTPNVVEFQALYKDKVGDMSTTDANSVGNLARCLHGVTVIRKGSSDIITNGSQILECADYGGPRRCGGQGDLLAGALAVFTYWTHMSSKTTHNNAIFDRYGPQLIAAYGACALTKTCNEIAYRSHGRSMLTSDMINCIHEAFTRLFPDKTLDPSCVQNS